MIEHCYRYYLDQYEKTGKPPETISMTLEERDQLYEEFESMLKYNSPKHTLSHNSSFGGLRIFGMKIEVK